MDRSKWEYKNIKDICTSVEDGDWIESQDQSADGIRLIQTGNIGVGEYLDKCDKSKYISEDTFERLNCKEVFPGDCLISRLPDPIGRSCIIPTMSLRMITAVDCSILRFKDFVLPNYFVLYSKSRTYNGDINKYATGATRKRISRKNLEGITIPIPPISDQQRIVAELDCLNEMIAVKQEQLKEFDKLAQSIFYDMFGDPVSNDKGWSLTTLGEHFAFSQGLQVPTDLQYLEEGKNRKRFLRIIDFTQGNEPARYIEEDSDKYYLLTNEIAIVRYGTPGFVCMGKEGVIANNLFKITSQYNDVNNWFLYFYLNSDAFQKPIRANQYGATMKAISFGSIKKIPFILPPLSLQQQFAEKISAIEAQKELVKQSIAETQALLDYTMDYYFNE